MKVLNFYYFEFSTYMLIIGLAFIIAFFIFYKILNKNISKVDVLYIYVINITGFAIGSKLLSLFSNKEMLTLSNFINSGYSYVGGILGSILLIFIYCKRYKLDFKHILSVFSVIYPIIYSVSKIGCFLNGCCGGIININNEYYKFPLQLIDSTIMFILFCTLLVLYIKKEKIVINLFFVTFSGIRFFEDFFRNDRNIIIFNFTLEQVICIILIIIFFLVPMYKILKKAICTRFSIHDKME